jgi:hypothetical protein|tara:strand:+ start:3039 stop:3497 length:459 start_codon:yes stop_codon:yes gene_type:complete
VFDFLLTAISGGATGIFGSVLGKAFSFIDSWQAEKKAKNDHARTVEMTRLQNELRSQELESELGIVEAQAASDAKTASYQHDISVGVSYPWVAAILRLVRPFLTFALIGLMTFIYIRVSDLAQQEAIIQSVIYMASTGVLWWFGDRAMRPKS